MRTAVRHEAELDQLCINLLHPIPVSSRPRDREENRAFFESLNVMRQVVVQCEQGSDRQIECTTFCSHRHMTGDSLDRDPAFVLVPGKSRACLQCDEDDAKVVILDEGLRVLAAVPVGFAVKLLQFPGQIEFEKGSCQRRRMRPPVLVVVVRGG